MERFNPGDGTPWLSRPGILIPVFVLAFTVTIVLGMLTARALLNGATRTADNHGPVSLRQHPTASPARQEPKTPQLPSWPMQGGGPAHTGAQTAAVGTPPLTGFGEIWHSSIKANAAGGATGSAGTVYVNSGDGVRAFDASTGAAKWHSATTGPVTTPPAIHGTTIVFTDTNGTLYSVNASSGQILWRRHADYAATAVTIAPPADGKAAWIYVATERGAEALNLAGLQQWAFPIKLAKNTPLSVKAGKAYFGSRDKSLYAVDALTGRLLWNAHVGATIVTPAAVDGTTVYVGSANGQISALSTSTGMIQWQHRAGNSIKQAIAVGQYGRTKRVFAVAGRKVIALMAEDGRASWTHMAPTAPLSAPSLTGEHLLLGEGSRAIALNPENGHPAWQKALDGPVTSTPVMSEGHLLVGVSGRQLHVFGPPPGIQHLPSAKTQPSPATPRLLAPPPATPAR
ncbi:MAG: PQQ-binding-like beta-propeller repeat protein [Pseudonocardiaceae bacterium]